MGYTACVENGEITCYLLWAVRRYPRFGGTICGVVAPLFRRRHSNEIRIWCILISLLIAGVIVTHTSAALAENEKIGYSHFGCSLA